MQPCKLAVAAAAAAQSAGAAPAILITILQAVINAVLPQLGTLLNGCLPQPTPAKTQRFVASRFNQHKQQYREGILQNAIAAVEQSAVDQGSPISESDARILAIATLDQVRTGPLENVAEAMQVSGNAS